MNIKIKISFLNAGMYKNNDIIKIKIYITNTICKYQQSMHLFSGSYFCEYYLKFFKKKKKKNFRKKILLLLRIFF